MTRSRFRQLVRIPLLAVAFTALSLTTAILPGGYSPTGDSPSAEASPNRRAWLGADLIEGPAGGVLARHVLRTSPADKAGLQDGDFVLSVDGKDVDKPRDVVERITELGPGKKMKIRLHRGGVDKDFEVLLEEHPGDLEATRRDKVGTFIAPLTGGKGVTAGTSEDLTKLKGHVVLLDFWASWCGACRQAVPTLNDLSDKYGAQGLTIIGATDDPSAVADKAAKKLSIHYGVVGEVPGDTMGAFLVHALPMLYLVDKKGVIRQVFVSLPADDVLDDSIKTLLAEP